LKIDKIQTDLDAVMVVKHWVQVLYMIKEKNGKKIADTLLTNILALISFENVITN